MALLVLSLFGTPAMGKDFGGNQDVQQIKTVVKAKLGHVANVSVSHDWAMCISNKDDNDLTVLLHRTGGAWKIVAQDGGAFQAKDLKAKGVPAGDIPQLLKTYQ